MDITDSDKSNNDVLITARFCYIALPKSLYLEDCGRPRRYGGGHPWCRPPPSPAATAIGIKHLIVATILAEFPYARWRSSDNQVRGWKPLGPLVQCGEIAPSP